MAPKGGKGKRRGIGGQSPVPPTPLESPAEPPLEARATPPPAAQTAPAAKKQKPVEVRQLTTSVLAAGQRLMVGLVVRHQVAASSSVRAFPTPLLLPLVVAPAPSPPACFGLLQSALQPLASSPCAWPGALLLAEAANHHD
jgi:hypothetical protein